MSRGVLGVIAGLVAACACEVNAGVVVSLVSWNFNGPQGSSVPSAGLGTASLVGATTATFAVGSPADSEAASPAENKGWNLAGFASQGSASGERGAQFAFSTVGFDSISVVWHERHSNSASRFVQLQYALDGKTFTSDGLANDGVIEATEGGDVWQAEHRVDIKGVAGAAGNALFAVRIVSIFAPGSSQYLPSSPSGNYAASGTIRLDLVRVEGVSVPAPAAATLGLAGALVAVKTRKRQE